MNATAAKAMRKAVAFKNMAVSKLLLEPADHRLRMVTRSRPHCTLTSHYIMDQRVTSSQTELQMCSRVHLWLAVFLSGLLIDFAFAKTVSEFSYRDWKGSAVARRQ